jgi:hypothetical protein
MLWVILLLKLFVFFEGSEVVVLSAERVGRVFFVGAAFGVGRGSHVEDDFAPFQKISV